MSVRLETSLKRYVGLSMDDAPIPYALGGTMGEDEPLPVGSVLFEEDTGRTRRWDGGRWYYLPDMPEIMEAVRVATEASLDKLESIIALLTKIQADEEE